MKRTILNKLALLLTLFIITGCRVQKPVTPPVSIPPQVQIKPGVSKVDILKNISDRQVIFNTLSLKAKGELSMGKDNNNVTMNIRMQKDKVIWVSVSVAVIGEVGRALITPDSIKILNRVENSYTKKAFNYIYQFTSKQVSFKTLQNVFIGNALEGTLNETSTLDMNGGQAHIKGDLAGLAYLLIFSANNTLIQSNLNDKAAQQSLLVNYGDYSDFAGQALPQTVHIKSAVSNKNIAIDLQYNHIGINESVDFPFSIPKRFTVKN
ncbi:MAG: DUF4292 domain-containing protein [Pyrinomonadaceae bacterium]|nr:DUF4292 domain-containing protein [Sphingobacteriaceae bacterium]